MNTGVMFLDCPAYTDRHGTARCGLPAAVQYRYTVSSTDGPQEAAKISCPHGHWFNAPLEALTRDRHPGTAPPAATPPAITRLGGQMPRPWRGHGAELTEEGASCHEPVPFTS